MSWVGDTALWWTLRHFRVLEQSGEVSPLSHMLARTYTIIVTAGSQFLFFSYVHVPEMAQFFSLCSIDLLSFISTKPLHRDISAYSSANERASHQNRAQNKDNFPVLRETLGHTYQLTIKGPFMLIFSFSWSSVPTTNNLGSKVPPTWLHRAVHSPYPISVSLHTKDYQAEFPTP